MFEYVRIEANNARGKRIERYYGALRYEIEKKREGWLARPFAMSESNQMGGVEVPQVPFDDIIAGCLADIETWNNMPHSKIKDKTRWEVFMEHQNPDVKPTNWRAFLPSLGYCTQTSCNVGQVLLNNGKFLIGDEGAMCYGERLIGLMDQIEGRELDVYWLDDNKGEVMKALVYLRNSDRCVCELIKKPTYSRASIEITEQDKANRTIMSHYENTINGYMKKQRNAIDQITVIDHGSTVERKFKMTDMMMPLIGQRAIVEQPEEVEILEVQDEEDNLNDRETTFKRSLKDRF